MTNESSSEPKISPMMAQWHACKKAAGDALLLFRMGDFYEAFYEDASILSRAVDLTLTQRQGIPMSGIPAHTYEAYVDKLVGKGFRVAIAEQMEDPKAAKGLVKREVTRVITPGTLLQSNLLSEKKNNFFACLCISGNTFGLACLDLSTSELNVCEFANERDLINEIYQLQPAEFLVSMRFQEKKSFILDEIKKSYSFLVNVREEWHFEHKTTYDFLINHFRVHSLDGFGLQGMTAAINASGALLAYLQDALSLPIHHVQEIRSYSTSKYLSLDRMTLRNLELTSSIQDGSRRNTLLEVLDQTSTPMGGRLIANWIKRPLLSIKEIQERQAGIQSLLDNRSTNRMLKEKLTQIRDLERLMMKISTGYANPRDLIALNISFQQVDEIKSIISQVYSSFIQKEITNLHILPEMTKLISYALVEEPALRPGEGKIFRDGYHQELDLLREISHDSKSWMIKYQTQLRDETGIKTLKVGFNKMFGYFIEVSRGQSNKMPDTFTRRQTLVNAERYITPELKEYESKVLTAEERIIAIENELFTALKIEVAKYLKQVLEVAQSIARIDCIRSLAEVAETQHYSCPQVDDSFILQIEEGRHPIIEITCKQECFIPNDTCLDNDKNRLLLITGPNMAGKSTYLRQVALIVIMAQIGSFVPAKAARIGLVDKVFTRIGASDDLSRGQSTFMVEMTETANILNNATSRSLVILDEIGRGTSTYDGISIAWAVAEHLLLCPEKMAKTLFATHYWELTKLEEKIPGAVNYNVAVHEAEDHITFLRKIVKGGTDKSYGIHVGRLAGLPSSVIQRAKELLAHLEENANRKSAFEPPEPRKKVVKKKVPNEDLQLTFF